MTRDIFIEYTKKIARFNWTNLPTSGPLLVFMKIFVNATTCSKKIITQSNLDFLGEF